jgi:hypothetical protein
MQKTIHFRPAFDKRHPNPSKNYGIHGMEIKFVLKMEKAAIQFVIFTNWHLPHVQAELEDKTTSGRDAALHFCPMGADVGYHTTTQQYEGQTVVSEECEYLDNKPCYYDGSSLAAEELLKQFIEHGEDHMWDYLEKYYNDRFGDKS